MLERPQYLIIISFDGLSSLDFETLKSLPHFKEYIKGASYCKKVYTIYPSLTYPAHTSIVTGRYPKNHGIVNNTLFQPGETSPNWYWFRKYIKGETLYDKAIDAGLTVAALLWPVTGRSRIQYNMPEIFANRPWKNQIIVSLFSGSPLYQIILNKKFGHIRIGLKEPELDNFVHQSSLYTINQYTPNLMLIHYTDLDSQRHRHGFNSLEAKRALIGHDNRLGDIIKTLKEKGIYEESAIVVLGDHSALDENKLIKPNVILKRKGLIATDKKGRLKEWKAIVKNCDGSAYVYLKNRKDKEGLKILEGVLQELSNDGKSGIESFYSSQEAANLGADPNCAFMLEARKGYYFSDDLTGDYITSIDPSDIGKVDHITAATHGYSPYKENYTTMFFASGKGVKSGIEIPEMNLVDEGPTIAKLLGVSLQNVDGKVIEEILK